MGEDGGEKCIKMGQIFGKEKQRQRFGSRKTKDLQQKSNDLQGFGSSSSSRVFAAAKEGFCNSENESLGDERKEEEEEAPALFCCC